MLNRDEVIDCVGADNWDQVKEEFEMCKTFAQVLCKLDNMFGDDNKELADSIFEELS